MNIQIVTTPNSSLKETGFGPLDTCNRFAAAIHKMGYEAEVSVCETKEELDQVREKNPDLVIPAVKYVCNAENQLIWLSEYFEKNNFCYSGSNMKALEFDTNKAMAKERLIREGIKTADHFTALPGQHFDDSKIDIDYPLFLKPLSAANGNGIDDQSYVSSFDEYTQKVNAIYQSYKMPTLVEEYLSGPEFTVGILEKQDGTIESSIIEIRPLQSSNGLKILGERARTLNIESLVHCEESELTTKIKALAVRAFQTLGARDYANVEFKLNERQEPLFMEINLVPSFIPDSSYYAKTFEIDQSINYDDVVKLIIDNCAARSVSSDLKPVVGL